MNDPVEARRMKLFHDQSPRNMGPGRDPTRDPWICSQTRICCQTRYRLSYGARYILCSILAFSEAILETQIFVTSKYKKNVHNLNMLIFPK